MPNKNKILDTYIYMVHNMHYVYTYIYFFGFWAQEYELDFTWE